MRVRRRNVAHQPQISELMALETPRAVLSRRKQLQWILYFSEGYKAQILREAQLGFTLDSQDIELLRRMYESMDSYIARLKVRMR